MSAAKKRSPIFLPLLIAALMALLVLALAKDGFSVRSSEAITLDSIEPFSDSGQSLDPQHSSNPTLGQTAIFTNVTGSAGIVSPLNPQHAPGIAWGDYDRDGWVDVYLTGGEGPNSLYHNNGDGTFSISDLSSSVVLSGTMSGGALFADYDNDGWLDLYVLNIGPNALFHNDDGLGFTDVTAFAGVGDDGAGPTGAWNDYDNDGLLDLYIGNFSCTTCPNGAKDTLYHNLGDGTFANVSSVLGNVTEGLALAVSFIDYDNDGDRDIYVINDKGTPTPVPPQPGHNILFRNDGPGCGEWCFTDVSVAAGADAMVNGMGIAIGDYDHDEDLDMYFSHAGPMVFLQNQTSQGSPTFLDISTAAGVDFDAIGWGTVFLDYDHDSWPDLYLATMDSDPAKANRLFHNDGSGAFDDVSAGSGADDNGPTLGLAYSDYDQDGWVDILIGNLNFPYQLYRNMGTAGLNNNWLAVELVGGGPINRDAIGSRVYVETSGGQTLMQEVKNGSSHAAGNEMTLYFGLGIETVDSVSVKWADGLVELFSGVGINQKSLFSYPVAQVSMSPGYTTTVAPSSIISLTHTITNEGTRNDTFTMTVDSTYGWATVSPTVIGLAPGESSVVEIIVHIPALVDVLEIITLTAASTNDPAVTAIEIDTVAVGWFHQFLPTIAKPD